VRSKEFALNHMRFRAALHLTWCRAESSEMAQELKKDREEGLEEAKELFKQGLQKIFQATKKISKEVVESFKEGYAKDLTKKEK
jgi:hypothetical protein